MNDDGSCWLDTHGDDPADTTDVDYGGPEGNDHAVGNDGGPPPGNFNAVDHGLEMSVRRRIEMFDDDQLDAFMGYYEQYEYKAENPGEAARLASIAVIIEELERDLFMDGCWIVKENDDGEEYKIPKQQTLEALFDANRELRLSQDYEGITNNSEGDSSNQFSGVSALWDDTASPETPSLN